MTVLTVKDWDYLIRRIKKLEREIEYLKRANEQRICDTISLEKRLSWRV